MTPRHGNALFHSSQQLPRVWPLKGFLSSHSTLQGPLTCLVHCLQNCREIRTQVGLLQGEWRSRTLSRAIINGKSRAFVKHTLVFFVLKNWGVPGLLLDPLFHTNWLLMMIKSLACVNIKLKRIPFPNSCRPYLSGQKELSYFPEKGFFVID